jgi:phenylalanyl-tRNA synthetase alpha chain
MTDLTTLERDLLTQVEGAADEAALEAVRVSALGKKGSVSELLKTLGAMTRSHA